MDTLKNIGLNLLFCVIAIVAIPMIILWAIAYFIMYACFSAFEWIVWELDDEEEFTSFDECLDIYAECCDCMRDVFLGMKTEL